VPTCHKFAFQNNATGKIEFMKCKLMILLIFAVKTVFCQTKEEDLAQLKQLNARFIHNFVTNDTASHHKIIHPDFVCIASNGAVIQREDYLKGWANGFSSQKFKYWDYREEYIRIFGSMALVRSMIKYIIISDGKESERMSIYTDTYVKESGEWRCVQAQITR